MSRTNAEPDRPDPLGIRSSTRAVMRTATAVHIDSARIADVARDLATMTADAPTWAHPLHWRGDPARMATWVFVLDALNFCFWSHDADPDNRWRVSWQGETHDGYWALAAALSRGVTEGVSLHDPAWLASVDEAEVAHLLRPTTAQTPTIPRFPDRVANLRELGLGLQQVGGGPDAALRLIEQAGGSAVRLVQEVVARFPSFADETMLDGKRVFFYKRAQILAADLAGAFADSTPNLFIDLDQLTAFADYKVPQVLRRFGLLEYAPALAARIARREWLAAGSREEVEIRAATVQAVELLREAISMSGREFSASQIDWLLWMAGQSLPPASEPYHRTSTVFY